MLELYYELTLSPFVVSISTPPVPPLKVVIYNSLGIYIDTVLEDIPSIPVGTIQYNANNLPSGVYKAVV